MGKMNLLKANWEGKVGETVGAKWKNKKTIRTYTKPSNPNTQAQRTVRSAFKELTSFVALFADQIKYLTALDTAGMSVRNAIIKLNKAMIESGTVALENVLISKGGLQKPAEFGMDVNGDTGVVTLTWNQPTATNFTEDAKAVLVVVDTTEDIAEVIVANATAGTAISTLAFSDAHDIYSYAYFLDKRGNAKVASASVNQNNI